MLLVFEDYAGNILSFIYCICYLLTKIMLEIH